MAVQKFCAKAPETAVFVVSVPFRTPELQRDWREIELAGFMENTSVGVGRRNGGRGPDSRPGTPGDAPIKGAGEDGAILVDTSFDCLSGGSLSTPEEGRDECDRDWLIRGGTADEGQGTRDYAGGRVGAFAEVEPYIQPEERTLRFACERTDQEVAVALIVDGRHSADCWRIGGPCPRYLPLSLSSTCPRKRRA